MAVCEVCGNDYDKAFRLHIDGADHVFDSFECAIHAVAPRCKACGVTITGHGVEADEDIFCCAHCASKHGRTEMRDRV